MDLITVATDGSCLTNPGFAGWGWFVDDDRWQAGSINHGTNQVAELSAVLHALTDIPANLPLLIQSDSQYAIKCASVWLPSWKRNNWRTANGGTVKNQDVIRAIDEALTARKDARGQVTFEWVRGHNGHLLNEAADLICGQAARAARDGQPDGTLHGPGWTGSNNPTGLSPLAPAAALAPRRLTADTPSKPPVDDLRLFDNW